jgi:integral membrane sensor domain MASE1
VKRRIVFSLIMGVITTGVISFTLIWINRGMAHEFVAAWTRSWAVAYVVVVPAILVIGPPVQKFVDHLFKEK